MRIVHVINTARSVAGAETVVAALTEAAHRQGWHSHVLNPFGHDPAASPLRAAVRPASYEGRSCQRPTEVPALRRWLGARFDEMQPSVVHVHGFQTSVVVASMRRVPGCARLLTHHHGNLLGSQHRRAEEQLDRWATRRYDLVATPSESVRRFLLDRHRIPADRVVAIPNGWSGAPRPGHPKQPVVVCAANLRASKGHDVLLAAFAAVVRLVPEARLTLLGQGTLEHDLRRRAFELGISTRVDFAGFVSDVWPHYADAAVFALASDHEPFGIAVLEAMASGLPVVATDVGGIPEVVAHDDTGLLVPPRDPDALAQAIVTLLRDRALAARLGAAAAARAGELTMEATAARYLDLYGDLVARAGRYVSRDAGEEVDPLLGDGVDLEVPQAVGAGGRPQR